MQDYVCVEDMLSRPVAAAPHTVHPPEEESFELFNTKSQNTHPTGVPPRNQWKTELNCIYVLTFKYEI